MAPRAKHDSRVGARGGKEDWGHGFPDSHAEWTDQGWRWSPRPESVWYQSSNRIITVLFKFDTCIITVLVQAIA
jgi:hypothetical protein